MNVYLKQCLSVVDRDFFMSYH